MRILRAGAVLATALSLGVAGPIVATAGQAAAVSPKRSKDPASALALGKKLRRSGKFAQAVRVLTGASLRRADRATAVALRYEAARALIEAGKKKQATRQCRSLKALSPVKAAACEAESHLLWKRASLALPAAERALGKDPRDYDALVAKGRAQRQVGKSSAAEALLRQAANADGGRWEAHYYLGLLLAARGKNKDAVAALLQSHKAAPEEPLPLLALGVHDKRSGQASRHLAKAIKIRPQFGAAHARRGEVLLKLGRRDAALAALDKALAIDPKQADWHAARARVLVAKKDYGAALSAADSALRLVSNHGRAKLAQADALAGKGEIDLAIEAYEHAHGYARTDPAPLVNAARACLKHRRPTTAAAFAERATQSFPKWGPGWVVLGRIHEKAGERADARAAYKKALRGKGRVNKRWLRQRIARLSLRERRGR